MKAARVYQWDAPPHIVDVPTPTPGQGESLVQVEAATVAHLDATVATGKFGVKPSLPYTGGVEGCGVVVESDVFEPGQRVVIRGGGLGLTRDGTWAEFVTVRSTSLFALTEGIDPGAGATFFVPTTTADVALRSVGQFGTWPMLTINSPQDERVIVAGAAGAVGSVVIQLALRAGSEVIAVVANESQAERISAGVTVVVESGRDEEALLAYDRERPGTLLVDTLGGAALSRRMGWVAAGGRAVSLGYVLGTQFTLDLSNWLLGDVALLPVNMIRRDREARGVAPAMMELLARGDLHIQVERYRLDQVGDALEDLRTGQVSGRPVLVP